MGTPPSRNSHKRGLRDSVSGWSHGSVRRNTAFLRSVDVGQLTGWGFAFTLTLRDTPATAGDWHKLRRAFEARLRRMGLIRLHWVTEWQRRKVPHLHGIAYFADDFGGALPIEPWAERLKTHWLEVADAYRPGRRGQHVAIVSDALGWLQYLGKHAARGVHHYQRDRRNLPPGWQGKTGRVWGKVGDWPTTDPVRFELSQRASWIYRRWVRAWRKAHARSERSARVRAGRIAAARRMLKCPCPRLSPVRGISEWIPPELTLRMWDQLAADGHAIQC